MLYHSLLSVMRLVQHVSRYNILVLSFVTCVLDISMASLESLLPTCASYDSSLSLLLASLLK